MLKRGLVAFLICALAFLPAFLFAPAAQAQIFYIASCGTIPVSMLTPVAGAPGEFFSDLTGKLCVNATISASVSGFTPSASGARATPLSVTTSDSSGNLPTGAVVVVSNVGTTNPMYCNVNGVAATTSDQLITANGGWFAFTIPAAITTLHCIATGGTTTANSVGGSGIPTGTGGGSGGGGGGGGAITAAASAYAAGAFSAGAGVDGWDLTQGTKGDTLATNSTSSWTVIALLKGIYAQLVLAVSGINSAIAAGTNVIGGIFGSPNVTPTDCSIALTAGGTAQNIITAGAALHGFTIANIDTGHNAEPVWFSLTTTAAALTVASYPLAPPTAATFANLASYTTPMGFGTNANVSVIAATTGHIISCTKW